MFSYLITNGVDQHRYLEFSYNLTSNIAYFLVKHKSVAIYSFQETSFDYAHMLINHKDAIKLKLTESDPISNVINILYHFEPKEKILVSKDIGFLTRHISVDIINKFQQFYLHNKDGYAVHSDNPLYDIGHSKTPLSVECFLKENESPQIEIHCKYHEDTEYYLKNDQFEPALNVKELPTASPIAHSTSLISQYWWLAVIPVGIAYFLYTKCKKKGPTDRTFLEFSVTNNVLREYLQKIEHEIKNIRTRTDISSSEYQSIKEKFSKEASILIKKKLKTLWKSTSTEKFRILCKTNEKEVILEMVTLFKKYVEDYQPPRVHVIKNKKAEPSTLISLTHYLKLKDSLVVTCEEHATKLHILQELHKKVKALKQDTPDPFHFKLLKDDYENPSRIKEALEQKRFEIANIDNLQEIERYAQIVESKLRNLDTSIKKSEKALEKLTADQEEKAYIRPTKPKRIESPKEKKSPTTKIKKIETELSKNKFTHGTLAKVISPTKVEKEKQIPVTPTLSFDDTQFAERKLLQTQHKSQNVKDTIQRAQKLLSTINIMLDSATDEKTATTSLIKKFQECKITFEDKFALKLALEGLFVQLSLDAPLGNSRYGQWKFRNKTLYQKFNEDNIILLSAVKIHDYSDENHDKVLSCTVEILVGLLEYKTFFHPSLQHLEYDGRTPRSKILAQLSENTLNSREIFSMFSATESEMHGDHCDYFQDLLTLGLLRNSKWIPDTDKSFVESYVFLRMISESVKSHGTCTHSQRILANRWRHAEELRDEITRQVLDDKTFQMLAGSTSHSLAVKK